MSELVIKNLSKNFGKKKALNNVSFKVSKGEIFGLIGPNGAGKTTLVNILSTLSLPTEGEVCISNLDAIFDVNLELLKGTVEDLMDDINVQVNAAYSKREFSELKHFTDLGEGVNAYEKKIEQYWYSIW